MIVTSYVLNGESRSLNFTNPREFLEHSERGAYTTAFVKDQNKVVDWDNHIKRLRKSLKALHTTLSGFYAAYFAQIQNLSEAEEEAYLSRLINPNAALALHAAATAASANDDDQMVLFILLNPSSTPNHPLDIHAVVSRHSINPSPSHAIHAVILAPPRQVPIGKDSGWVTDRKKWEAIKPQDAGEILLCSQDGKVLEGLVTNFYIVTRNDQNKSQVQTAHTDDGVVWGTIREHIKQACQHLGIEFIETAPNMKDREAWQEAFVTNSLRIVQPLKSIACDERNFYGHAPWHLDFSSSGGDCGGVITQQLYEYVMKMLPCVSI